MDRNTVTGFVLIFAMVIVYQLYFVPAPEPQASNDIPNLGHTRGYR